MRILSWRAAPEQEERMAEDKDGRILGDMSSYVLDWLVAKPAQNPQQGAEKDEGKRINTLMAMFSKESNSGGNVLPFKSRKK